MDTKYFVNQSRDSILLTPGTKLEFKTIPGVYSLTFEYGILKDFSPINGKLIVSTGGRVLTNINISDKNIEKWLEFKDIFRLSDKIELEWVSAGGNYLFLGRPLLVPGGLKQKKPNVILFVIDSLRHDSLGYAGNPIPSSPNIDSIAKDSIIFPNAYTNANWTKPSMISMFYGDYASNLGIGNTGFEVESHQKKAFYSLKRKSLVQTLRENNFFTASIMNNVFLLEYTSVGIDLGFQELVQIGKDPEDTEKITEYTLDFLKKDHPLPFFLHVNYNTPHGGYTPPAKVLAKLKKETDTEVLAKTDSIKMRYNAEIRYADEEIGKLIQVLKEKGLYDNTIIILTADHGELFSDSHTSNSNGIWGIKHGHGVTLYEEEIRVPFFIKLPVSMNPKIQRRKIPEKFSLVSLYPTLMGLLDIEFSKQNIKGEDFSTLITGESSNIEESIYTEGRLSESIVTDDFKFIRRYPAFTNTELAGRVLYEEDDLTEIYNLKKDSEEKENLNTDPDLLLRMKKEFEKKKLNLNSLYIHIPAQKVGEAYSGTLYVKGSIYNYSAASSKIKVFDKRQMSFETIPTGNKEVIVVQTVQPIFDFDLRIYKSGQEVPYRIGKWGILKKDNSIQNPILLVSEEEPKGWETDELPWIYNDGKLLSEKVTSITGGMGEEVRNILKGWGYIHE